MSTFPKGKVCTEEGLAPFASEVLNADNLKKLATTKMPFGKYQGRSIIDLPEAYLLWFVKKEAFPKGNLGDLMKLSLELHIHGLIGLIYPLKNQGSDAQK